ncbi:MAG: lipoyl synthase [Chitinivibrionales bacterium]|nr:lipoyl synthase [Chitinivibrionales bacterium]
MIERTTSRRTRKIPAPVSAEVPSNGTVRFPSWLKRGIPSGGRKSVVESRLDRWKLHTVCKEARCPNRCECYASGRATFLIMGETCTRNCAFCGINSDAPAQLDRSEPEHLSRAVKELGLRYVVITSVTRDDLPDGGATHFAAVVHALKRQVPGIRVEVLVPDFRGNMDSVRTVIESGIDVFNHNIETVHRLYPSIRPAAQYRRSLDVLAYAAKLKPDVPVKSGIMVGLGETGTGVIDAMHDLLNAGCTILTIGQYLQPSDNQVPVTEFIAPGVFDRYAARAREMGFAAVVAGPFVRSSYRAEELYRKVKNCAENSQSADLKERRRAHGSANNVSSFESI